MDGSNLTLPTTPFEDSGCATHPVTRLRVAMSISAGHVESFLFSSGSRPHPVTPSLHPSITPSSTACPQTLPLFSSLPSTFPIMTTESSFTPVPRLEPLQTESNE